MPRILLSAAHIAPLVLSSIGVEHETPKIAASYPALPKPFLATAYRIETLQKTVDIATEIEAHKRACEESAKKPFCNNERSRARTQRWSIGKKQNWIIVRERTLCVYLEILPYPIEALQSAILNLFRVATTMTPTILNNSTHSTYATSMYFGYESYSTYVRCFGSSHISSMSMCHSHFVK